MVDYDLAFLHDPAKFADGDLYIGERVAVDRDKVSEVAWSDGTNLCADRFGSGHQHDLWVEECACDALRDADEIALSMEDFDEWSGGHLRKIDGTTVADPGDVFVSS
jgi:hypothetical protein